MYTSNIRIVVNHFVPTHSFVCKSVPLAVSVKRRLRTEDRGQNVHRRLFILLTLPLSRAKCKMATRFYGNESSYTQKLCSLHFTMTVLLINPFTHTCFVACIVWHVLTYISSVRSRIFSLLACAKGSSLLWLTAGLGGGENARRLLFLKGKEIELF